MPVPQKTLRVLPNPYCHLDEYGRPCGACPMEVNERAPARSYVGATLKAKETRAAKTAPMRSASGEVKMMMTDAAEHEVWFEFGTDVVTVENTAYYRLAIQNGEILAADQATAKAAGLGGDTFVDPLRLLDELKANAIARYTADHGESPEATEKHSMRPMKKVAAAESADVSSKPLAASKSDPIVQGSK